MAELIKKAEKLAENCKECSVSAITENGFPRVCMLTPLRREGIKKVWFATGTSTKKVGHYKNNPKAGVTFSLNGDCVILVGTMELVADEAEKSSLWSDWMGRHFPNGGAADPEYCPLRFVASEATIYIDDDFITIPL